MGPDELVRIAHVARRHYIDGRSKIEIAAELGISRFRIARMLDDATARGIVKITIESPESIDLDVSIELKDRFDLKRALAVITPSANAEIVQDRLGQAAAELLREVVVEGDVLGVTAGRTLTAMTGHLKRIATCEVVQLSGVAAPTPENGVEVIRRISRSSGGRARAIFAPLLVDSASTATALRREPGILETYRRFDSITKAVVAVGSWNPPDSQLYESAERAGLLDAILAEGVHAEICSTFLSASGEVIELLADRTLGISTSQLKHIPEIIAVAGGALKTAAVLAALRSGLISSLITDAALARRLLAMT